MAKVLIAGYLVSGLVGAAIVGSLDRQMRVAYAPCLQGHDGPYQTVRFLLQSCLVGVMVCVWQAAVNFWWKRKRRDQVDG
jgi:hypothetical protein